MTEPETRAQAIDRLTAEYIERADRLPADLPRLSPDEFRRCLQESVARTGRPRLLKNAPTFRERPYGSIFLRLYRWHGNGGQLDGYMMARWDCDWMRRLNDDVAWKAHNFPSFDAFDTTAMLARGGSPAAERWREVLGR